MRRWGLVATLVVAWEVAGRTLITDPRTALLVPLPSTIAATAWSLALDGSLAAHLLRSTARVAAGAGLATLVGVPLGAVIASTPIGPVLEAPLRLLRPIPPVAWAPLTLLWLGIGELQQAVVLGLAALFVVASASADAVRAVPDTLIHAAINLGSRDTSDVLRIRLYHALPAVMAGVREGFGVAWFVLVAAEMLSATQGLGVLVLEGRDMLEPARTFVGMAALGLAGIATDRLLAAAQARWTRWA